MRFLAEISIAFRAALSVLSENRWRSLLTLAVCGTGTAGIMLAGVLAEINLAEMQTRLSALGGNLLVISPNKLPPFPGRARQLEHFISLAPEDVPAIAEAINAEAVVPVVARETTIRSQNRSARVRLVGTTPDYLKVRNFRLGSGRFLSSEDDGERTIVLGYAVSRELGLEGIEAGEIVFVGNNPYTVIGEIAPQGVNFAGEDEDHQVFVPLTTYQRRIANRPWLSHLYVQLSPEADSRRTVTAVQSLLRGRHGRWDYQVDDTLVRNLADLAAEQSQLLTTVVWVVSITGVVLLLIGIAGIATLMLLVVRQRRAEIGLRRALGATPADIAFQFLIEGMILAGTGILLGLVVGISGSLVLKQFFPGPAMWNSNLPLIGVLLSVIASAAACAVPAVIAARLEPAVALQP